MVFQLWRTDWGFSTDASFCSLDEVDVGLSDELDFNCSPYGSLASSFMVEICYVSFFKLTFTLLCFIVVFGRYDGDI